MSDLFGITLLLLALIALVLTVPQISSPVSTQQIAVLKGEDHG